MIERNEFIGESLRHIVLNVKDTPSSDYADLLSDNWRMSDGAEDDKFTKDLVLRTRAARNARVPKTTQEEMAALLGIEQTTYSKYESPGRPTRLPHELIWQFCNVCGVEMAWLLTGRGRGPAIESHAIFEQKNIRSRKRQKKARAA
jgi:transcriptional regulator with XRE-family HTH domain